ncbi:MAG: hypothetical protein HZA20_05960 [Nitrospirae bacterium]|nr:hypothetical protein [Nitrospirota bacterium]
MDFNQFAKLVKYFLPETKRYFLRIRFLDVAGNPAHSAPHIQPVSSAATGKFLPITKFLLIAFP